MAKLQVAQATVANWHKKKPLIYKVENEIWLLTKNIKTEKLSKS